MIRLRNASFMVGAVVGFTSTAPAQTRPFGTLRDQATTQQAWLEKRLKTVLPGLMRKHGIDMWVIPMREYNEDPTFTSLVSPTTFAARRRTIYVFFDKCAAPSTGSGQARSAGSGQAAGTAPTSSCVERIALGGTSQGGVFEVEVNGDLVFSKKTAGRHAEEGEILKLVWAKAKKQ